MIEFYKVIEKEKLRSKPNKLIGQKEKNKDDSKELSKKNNDQTFGLYLHKLCLKAHH